VSSGNHKKRVNVLALSKNTLTYAGKIPRIGIGRTSLQRAVAIPLSEVCALLRALLV